MNKDNNNNKIILNKEQAHIVGEFFRRYNNELVWKIDNKIYDLINDILLAQNENAGDK
jgi:hypothetical protein